MNIYVAWHLGLGDAIACSAIVAKLSQDNFVNIPCWKHNESSVKSFFINQPSVLVHCIDDDAVLKSDEPEKFNDKVVRLGYYNKDVKQNPDEDFVQWFYRQAGMDISEKEKYCPIKEASKSFPYERTNKEDLIFIHSDIIRGFEISLPEYLRGDNTGYRYTKPICINSESILRYSGHLTQSSEIHCIDSSFLHLAEALSVTGKKFYHKYARPNSTDFKYLKGWEVIQ